MMFRKFLFIFLYVIFLNLLCIQGQGTSLRMDELGSMERRAVLRSMRGLVVPSGRRSSSQISRKKFDAADTADRIAKALEVLRGIMTKGAPSIHLPPLDPWVGPPIKEDFKDPKFSAILKADRVSLAGISQFVVQKIFVDPGTGKAVVKVYFPSLVATSKHYTLVGSIMKVYPLFSEGRLYALFKHVTLRIEADTMYDGSGKLQIAKPKMKLSFKNLRTHFSGSTVVLNTMIAMFANRSANKKTKELRYIFERKINEMNRFLRYVQ